jgi:hypothetical protein
MSQPAEARLLAQFAGGAACERSADQHRLRLRGREKGGQGELDVLISGDSLPTLPATLQAAQLVELGQGARRRWQLTAVGVDVILQGRGVQVHRPVGARFAAAVPPLRAGIVTRLGWWLLLKALRLPGAARLLQWIRSR